MPRHHRPRLPLLLTVLVAQACTEPPTDRPLPDSDTGVDPALLTDEDNDGWTLHDGDCDDGDATISPGADEDCTEIDRNCDGDPFGGVVWEIAAMVKDERDDSEPFKAVSWWYDLSVSIQTREHDARLVETRWFLSPDSGLPRWQDPISVETSYTTADEEAITVRSATWHPSSSSPIQSQARTDIHDPVTGWRLSSERRDQPNGDTFVTLTTWTRNDRGIVTGQTVHMDGLIQSELTLELDGDTATGTFTSYSHQPDHAEPIGHDRSATRTYDEHGQLLSDHVEESRLREWAWGALGEMTSQRFGSYDVLEWIGDDLVRSLTWHSCFEQTWEDGERLTRTTYDGCELEPELRQPLQTTTFVGSCVVPNDWQDVLYFWEEDTWDDTGEAASQVWMADVPPPTVGVVPMPIPARRHPSANQ